jgi:phosphoenolpyruvate---glycerone phosphotransferase subunit DhaL
VSGSLDAAAFRDRVRAVSPAITASRQPLNALDAQAGDGDIGETLTIGFAAIAEALGSAEPATVGGDLRLAGTVLGRSAPSTFGTLIGLALRDAGKALADRTELSGPDLVTLLDAMAEGVARRGEVGPGDRTVLDALLASREMARGADAEGAQEALRAMAAGAADGAAATAGMKPRVGRAGWVGERAHGLVDAGAAAWAVIAGALAGDDSRIEALLGPADRSS